MLLSDVDYSSLVIKAELSRNQEISAVEHKVLYYYTSISKSGDHMLKIKIKRKKLVYKGQVYILNDIYGEGLKPRGRKDECDED